MKRKVRSNLRIVKASGLPETFSRKKLFQSLIRSGLSKRQCQLITDRVSREIYEGSKTSDIYKKTFQLVKASSPVAGAHYSLKRALFDLGPEGHHFEEFVARYFKARGFSTQTCQIRQGKFVKHEVDVIAKDKSGSHYVECKFHNRSGIKNDIKISLYVKARWDDLKDGPEGKDLAKFYIASNTAFSIDAITYAKGTGLELFGVNAPESNSFLDEIKKLKIYPLTSLRSIPRHVKHDLLKNNIILITELLDRKELLKSRGFSDSQIERTFEEIRILEGLL